MTLSVGEKFEKMKQIRDELLEFHTSPLYGYRIENKYFPVVGEGSHGARIMFVGEAPGENEAKTARPFTGKSGKLLDEMLESIKLNRSDVYITNIVKDRPPASREPSGEEVAAYVPFLDREIQTVEPKVIATLGKSAMNYVFTKMGLTAIITHIRDIHGKEFIGKGDYGAVAVIPLYHPAVGLTDEANKQMLVNDFQVLKKYV